MVWRIQHKLIISVWNRNGREERPLGKLQCWQGMIRQHDRYRHTLNKVITFTSDRRPSIWHGWSEYFRQMISICSIFEISVNTEVFKNRQMSSSGEKRSMKKEDAWFQTVHFTKSTRTATWPENKNRFLKFQRIADEYVKSLPFLWVLAQWWNVTSSTLMLSKVRFFSHVSLKTRASKATSWTTSTITMTFVTDSLIPVIPVTHHRMSCLLIPSLSQRFQRILPN